jgi:hypothetical protein
VALGTALVTGIAGCGEGDRADEEVTIGQRQSALLSSDPVDMVLIGGTVKQCIREIGKDTALARDRCPRCRATAAGGTVISRRGADPMSRLLLCLSCVVGGLGLAGYAAYHYLLFTGVLLQSLTR